MKDRSLIENSARDKVKKAEPKSLQLVNQLIRELEELDHLDTENQLLKLLEEMGDEAIPAEPDIPDVKDPIQEKARILQELKTTYAAGMKDYESKNLDLAEAEFAKVLKPVLSKLSMQSLYVTVDDCKELLLDSLKHLGKIYLVKNYSSENYSKVAAIFQYCARFAEKYKIGNPEEFLQQAYEVETHFLTNIGRISGDNTQEHKAAGLSSAAEIDHYKGQLKQIRQEVKERLESIKDLTITQIEQRTKEVELIYQDCTKFFVNNGQDGSVGLVQQMLASCFRQLGKPPKDCHSIIGLGSLASGRMTPWSDLEFAILINEDKEEYKEYFRNLTKLLHIKVINLGETPLRSAGVESLNNFRTTDKSEDWFWDELSTNGFSFDGPDWHACKFPLGRQGGYQAVIKTKLEDGTEREVVTYKPNYELILTPKDLARFQSEQSQDDNKESWFKSDPHLVEALRLVSLIDGRQDLLDAYRQEVQQAAGIEVVRARALGELQQDVSKFSLKVGDGEEGKLLDVKKDIFRIGDRVINDLADYYGIMAEEGQPKLTVWQIIDKMKGRNILSHEGAKHLKEAISIATELRLSTYSHNKGQKEGMSTYQPATEHLSEKQKKILLEETFYIKDTSILHHFYYVMLPLQTIATAFYEAASSNPTQQLLKLYKLFVDSDYAKGMVHARFLEYDRALIYMEKATEQEPQNLEILDDLFLLYVRTQTVEKALQIAQSILNILKGKHRDNLNHLDIAASYTNLGTTYNDKGESEEAIRYYNLALKVKLKAYEYSPNYSNIAASCNNLGNAFYSKGDYEGTIKYCNLALKIYSKAYKNGHKHPDIATIYNSLGNAYDAKGESEEAIKYHERALEIRFEAYKHSPNHTDIAGSYTNLGNAYRSTGKYDEAIEYYNLALKIQNKAYKNSPNHPDIAGSCNNLGNAYRSKGEYDEAIKYYNLALEIRLKAYEHSPNHPAIATSYNNLGAAYRSKGEYEKAIKYHKLALEIRLKAYEHNPNHPDIATSCSNLGTTYDDKGEYEEAIKCHKLALEIRLKAYEYNPNHSDIAASYNNLGNTYHSKGEYETAIRYHEQALEIRFKAYKNSPNHPSIADSYNNLGGTYYVQGDYQQALSCVEEALKIFSSYKHKQNFMIASTNRTSILAQLGNEVLLKGDEKKAREYYAQIDPAYEKINFNSKKFIELQLEWQSVAYKSQALHAAINSQLVLLKLDIELQYGNHYHNLACLYSSKGEIELANQTFLNALTVRTVSAELRVEYAQFLILNRDILGVNKETILKNLYVAIKHDGDELTYGKMEKNSICKVIKEAIERKNGAVTIQSKVLACYLLIKHPEYILEGDNIANLFRLLKQLCDNSQNYISFKLLTDAYESIGDKILAAEYQEQADILAKIDDMIKGKIKINATDDSGDNFGYSEIIKMTKKLNSAAEAAISGHRFNDAGGIYAKLYEIYTKVLVEHKEQAKLIINSLATIDLLSNDIESFIQLKSGYDTELNMDLIKLAGLNPDQILAMADKAMMSLHLPPPLQEVMEQNAAPAAELSQVANFSQQDEVPMSGATDNQ